MMRALLFAAALAAILAAAPLPALAQSCSLNIGALDFGNVNPFVMGSATAAAPVRAQCTQGVAAAAGCPSIGFGSGGTASSPRRRLLATDGTAGFLEFDLFRDASFTTPFGSRDHSGVLGLPQARAIGSVGGPYIGSVYGRLRAPAALPRAGTYRATFAGSGNAYMDYGLLSGLVACTSPLLTARASTSFIVSATIQSQCLIEAAPLNFGTTGVIASAIDATTTLSAQCTPGTAYSISMNGGRSEATDPANRQMTGPGGNVRYGVYRDPARSQPWGIGTAVLSGAGTGARQSVPVYGRVPPQRTPLAGIYNDVIVVTITYGG